MLLGIALTIASANAQLSSPFIWLIEKKVGNLQAIKVARQTMEHNFEMMRRYPVGIQTFSEIREGKYVYVDKTDLVWRMANRSKYVFLSRPRRFGKSLLTSTLRSYFEGRKDLFEGLAIEQLEKDWTEYPVLQFDMSGGKHMNPESLNSYLDTMLQKWESIYGKIPGEGKQPNERVEYIIEQACKQTGKQVVVLIDEYDAPLLDTMVDEAKFDNLRNIMRNFYSPLKKCDPYLRFVFLTGITKFSQLSIFSELNNIRNVSMEDEFAAICGITKEELLTQLTEDIDVVARKYKVSREEMVNKLTAKYDGYHFTAESPDIFNPFSLLNCFESKRLDSYWFGSGTPTFLIEQLKKFQMLPSTLGSDMKASATSFDAPSESLTSIIPLLYQSGYLTIKSYNPRTENYTLGIPNEEVRCGLMNALVPNYLRQIEANTPINEMTGYMIDGDVNGALEYIKQYFRTVPYCDNINYEGHWQQMLYVVFSLFGAKGDCEVRTADGRVDLKLAMWGKVFLMEIKLDGTAEEAMRQINDKDYAGRFALMGLPIVKIGVNFSTKERTMTEWIIA